MPNRSAYDTTLGVDHGVSLGVNHQGVIDRPVIHALRRVSDARREPFKDERDYTAPAVHDGGNGDRRRRNSNLACETASY
jgi:hypothetical protein